MEQNKQMKKRIEDLEIELSANEEVKTDENMVSHGVTNSRGSKCYDF
jgi:precorrin isomerase